MSKIPHCASVIALKFYQQRQMLPDSDLDLCGSAEQIADCRLAQFDSNQKA